MDLTSKSRQVFKSAFALFLSLCLAMLMVPVSHAAADEAQAGNGAAATIAYQCTSLGNAGAQIAFEGEGVTASVDDASLASVAVEGNVATVTAVEGATGIATVTLSQEGAEPADIEVPIGYTTFRMEGTSVVVIPGSDSNFEVSAINVDGTELSQKELASETTDEGYTRYLQTTVDGKAYSLLVNVKKKGGTYVFEGNATDVAVCVAKEATKPATLLLGDLDLASQITAPVTVKKDSESTVSIQALAGHVATLTDAELNNADVYGAAEDGGDGTNENYAESAVIKGKTASQITLCGKGTLNLVCKSKNAVKVGTSGSLTVRDLTLNVDSVRHGLSSDNKLTVESGTIDILCREGGEGDGLRCSPDAVDASAGMAAELTVLGGTITAATDDNGFSSDGDLTIGRVGDDDSAINITVTKSYEGMQGKVININSGTISVTASDDGINASLGNGEGALDLAAAGPDENSDELAVESEAQPGVVMNINGGYVWVDADLGDGLDSNGDMYLNGGTIVVFNSHPTGVDRPIDSDGAFVVKGATLFAAGSARYPTLPGDDSQPYISTKHSSNRNLGSTTIAAGTTVNVIHNGEVAFSVVTPREVGYMLFSSPHMYVTENWWFDPTIDEICKIYRLYNPKNSEHLWTASDTEYGYLPEVGWTQEDVAWVSPGIGSVGVYRLYNAGLDTHHYTTGENEVRKLVEDYGWTCDNGGKPIFYSSEADGALPVYRLYNDALGQHHYTTSENERNTLISFYGWVDEGIEFYADAE